MIVTRDWYLSINDIPLATPSWEVPNLDEILNDPPTRLGSRILPGATGRRYLSDVLDARTAGPFPLDIFGDIDADASAIADPLEGMERHRQYLKAHLGQGTGLVPIVLHRDDLPDLSTEGVFLGMKGWTTINPDVGLARTTFDLFLPTGDLEESGS